MNTPWTSVTIQREAAGRRHDDEHVWLATDYGAGAEIDISADHRHDAEEIGRLICAAPGLLSALSEVVDIADQGDTDVAWQKAISQARAAIARANGEPTTSTTTNEGAH